MPLGQVAVLSEQRDRQPVCETLAKVCGAWAVAVRRLRDEFVGRDADTLWRGVPPPPALSALGLAPTVAADALPLLLCDAVAARGGPVTALDVLRVDDAVAAQQVFALMAPQSNAADAMATASPALLFRCLLEWLARGSVALLPDLHECRTSEELRQLLRAGVVGEREAAVVLALAGSAFVDPQHGLVLGALLGPLLAASSSPSEAALCAAACELLFRNAASLTSVAFF